MEGEVEIVHDYKKWLQKEEKQFSIFFFFKKLGKAKKKFKINFQGLGK